MTTCDFLGMRVGSLLRFVARASKSLWKNWSEHCKYFIESSTFPKWHNTTTLYRPFRSSYSDLESMWLPCKISSKITFRFRKNQVVGYHSQTDTTRKMIFCDKFLGVKVNFIIQDHPPRQKLCFVTQNVPARPFLSWYI